MDTMKFFIYLAISAGVTYLIRMIPFVLCRGKMENQFIRSFLFYVPYAVLGAMTFRRSLPRPDRSSPAVSERLQHWCWHFGRRDFCRWQSVPARQHLLRSL